MQESSFLQKYSSKVVSYCVCTFSINLFKLWNKMEMKSISLSVSILILMERNKWLVNLGWLLYLQMSAYFVNQCQWNIEKKISAETSSSTYRSYRWRGNVRQFEENEPRSYLLLDTPSLGGSRAKRNSAIEGKVTEGEEKEIEDKPTEVTAESIFENILVLLKLTPGFEWAWIMSL